jgi:hypothetical protein
MKPICCLSLEDDRLDCLFGPLSGDVFMERIVLENRRPSNRLGDYRNLAITTEGSCITDGPESEVSVIFTPSM